MDEWRGWVRWQDGGRDGGRRWMKWSHTEGKEGRGEEVGWGRVRVIVLTSKMKPKCCSWGSRNTYLFSPRGGVRRQTELMLLKGSALPGGLTAMSGGPPGSTFIILNPREVLRKMVLQPLVAPFPPTHPPTLHGSQF